MRYSINFLLVMIFCVVGDATGQQSKQDERKRAVRVPSDYVLLVVAHQPDCPLKIQNPDILLYLDGTASEVYELQNCGTKTIRGYTIASWTSTGGGNITTREPLNSTEYLLPNQTLSCPGDKKIEIVPVTEQLREKLKLKGGMKAVTVFMVARVDFADGTAYSDEAALKGLQDYFQKVGAAVVVK